MEKVETKPTATDRPKRKRVGARDRLAFTNLDPNRQYRIIDMTPERLAEFEDAGYRIEDIKSYMRGGQRTDVATPMDNAISVGGTKKQVLVSIERELYEEDQAVKQREGPDAREAGIKQQAQEAGLTGEVKLSTDARRRS